jgi:hypothetical protein
MDRYKKPDYSVAETQLAINVYNNLKRSLGKGTLTRLQKIIMDFPMTKVKEREDIHPLDDDD